VREKTFSTAAELAGTGNKRSNEAAAVNGKSSIVSLAR